MLTARINPRLVIGSREWWKNTDLVSQRRNSTYVNLDSDSLNDLNDFFALLCSDNSYVPASDVVIASDVEIPQITERQVWNILAKLKRTATGPDENTLLVLGGSRRAFDTGHYAHLEFVLGYPLLADILEEG